MILKKNLSNIEINFKETNNSDGLSELDMWYMVYIDIMDKNVNIKFIEEAITKYELVDLLSRIDFFLKTKKAHKERITFIKNYFKIFLIANRKKEKRLIIELVHVNNTKDNYEFSLDEDEIYQFVDEINVKRLSK